MWIAFFASKKPPKAMQFGQLSRQNQSPLRHKAHQSGAFVIS
jgi:hypothetical protein